MKNHQGDCTNAALDDLRRSLARGRFSFATVLVLMIAPVAIGCGGGESSSSVGGGGGNTGEGGATDDDPMLTGGQGGTGGPMEEPDPCAPRDGTLIPEVLSVEVTNTEGAEPAKGDRLRFRIELTNAGTGVGPLTVTPRIDSLRFSDYTSVPLGTAEGTLCEGRSFVEVEGGPFLERTDVSKYYALGSGDYVISSIEVSWASGNETQSFDSFQGDSFSVAASNALLIPVVYDESYFEEIQGLTTDSPEAYLTQAFTRSAQIFTPDSMSDPDGAGSFEDFPQGFDEMMGVRHLFRTFPGFVGNGSWNSTEWCTNAANYGREVLGMEAEWEPGRPQGTQHDRHGFDYLMALSSDLGGGLAWGWLDVQVSGFINRDRDRQQIILVHETGHLFGAPHCDDVGNGEGGSLQGYVMCAGEKHEHYPEHFVFHSESRNQMSSKWD